MTDPLDLYAALHTAPEPPLLAQLTRETHLQTLLPRMSSGHVQGRFLSLLSHLSKPQRILEIGTFCGYATLCLAEGLADNGLLHTIEIDPEREARIRRYVATAGIADRVRLHIGAALDVLAGLVDEVWDLVFIDADKRSNAAYFEAVIDHVRPGGLVVAGALVAAALLRLMLPRARAGGLVVRSRPADVVFLLGMGLALFVIVIALDLRPRR